MAARTSQPSRLWHQRVHLGTAVFNYPDIWLLSRSTGFPRDSPKSLFSIRKVSRSYRRSWSRRLQLLVQWDVWELRVVEQKRGQILILMGEWWVETLEIIPGYKESSRKKRSSRLQVALSSLPSVSLSAGGGCFAFASWCLYFVWSWGYEVPSRVSPPHTPWQNHF